MRPGTAVGFQGSRVQKVLTPVAEGKSRKLPKYEAKMYCTPGALRLLTVKGMLVGDKEQMVVDCDEHHVFCRPKHYVDSSGTTWANEEMELRHVKLYMISKLANIRHNLRDCEGGSKMTLFTI